MSHLLCSSQKKSTHSGHVDAYGDNLCSPSTVNIVIKSITNKIGAWDWKMCSQILWIIFLFNIFFTIEHFPVTKWNKCHSWLWFNLRRRYLWFKLILKHQSMWRSLQFPLKMTKNCFERWSWKPFWSKDDDENPTDQIGGDSMHQKGMAKKGYVISIFSRSNCALKIFSIKS